MSISADGRNGSCLVIAKGSETGPIKNFAPSNIVTVGMAVQILVYGDPVLDHDTALIGFNNNGTTGVYISIDRTAAVGAYVGSTLVASGKCALALNGWYYIEATVYADSTDGIINVLINDEKEMGFNGNTISADVNSTTFDSVTLLPNYNANPGGVYKIDDFYICDSSDVPPNGPLGSVDILPSRVGGVGLFATWSNSPAVANYLNVDDTTPDSSATFNYTYTQSFGDLFVTTNPNSSNKIAAWQVMVSAGLSDVGVGNIRPLVFCNTTLTQADTMSLKPGFDYARTMYVLNPVTASSWSVSDMNSMQAGYRLV
jgi:hypothetical protein